MNSSHTGIPGLKVELLDDPSPLDFFYLIFDSSMCDTLITFS